MKNKDQWIVWSADEKKMPFAPWTGNQAPVHPLKSKNWTSFIQARKYYEQRGYDGLGFVFTPEDDIVGIDLDDCVKETTIRGNNVSVRLTQPHQDIMDSLNSFTEISQSGDGIHIYIRGELGGELVDNDVDVEIYDRGRFFCMTGKVVTDYSQNVEERGDKLDDIKTAYMDDAQVKKGQSSSSDYSGGGNFESSEFEPSSDSEFDTLSVDDVFPELDIPCKTGHPVHGSKTGSNFLVHDDDGYTSTCFRADCSYGEGPGCLMLPQHLIAMEMKGWESCSRVREEWCLDMRIEAWKYAVQNLGVTPLEIPVSITAGLGRKYDVDPFAGGSTSISINSFLKRKLKEEYEVNWF